MKDSTFGPIRIIADEACPEDTMYLGPLPKVGPITVTFDGLTVTAKAEVRFPPAGSVVKVVFNEGTEP